MFHILMVRLKIKDFDGSNNFFISSAIKSVRLLKKLGHQALSCLPDGPLFLWLL